MIVLRSVVLWLICAPLLAQTAFVSGSVFSDGNQQLNDMTVAAYTLSGELAATTATDSQGRYLLALPPATYRLLAYDNRGTYATSFYSNARSFETSAQITLTPGQQMTNTNFVLVRGFKVSGRVDSSLLGPLTNIVVAAYNLDGSRRGFVKTNAGGLYTIVLPPGDYKFVAYDENFASALMHAPEFYLEQTSFEPAATVSVRSDVSALNFTLAAGSKVTGRVRDKLTGAPVAGVVVGAYEPNGGLRYSTTTNTLGEFLFVLPEGTFRLVAADPEGNYAVSYYRDSPSFESSAAVSIVRGQTVNSIDFGLIPIEDTTNSVVFVPAVANTPGAGDTFFQTDLWIRNPSATESLSVTVTFLLAERDNSARQGLAVTVGPRQQAYYRNVLQTLFSATGTGALKLEASDPFQVTSRTYNNPPDAAQVGTFGLAMPGLDIGESLGRALISGLSNNEAYRSNVGVLNPHPREINVTYRLFDAAGTQIATQTRTFLPLEWFQANTIMTFLNVDAQIENAYLTLSSTDGSFFAYGSLVDQKSGDGSIINAVPE